MNKLVKYAATIAITILVIGAFTWQYVLSVGLLWQTIKYSCDNSNCAQTPSIITIPTESKLAVNELEFNNVIVPTAFVIASTSQDNQLVKATSNIDTNATSAKSISVGFSDELYLTSKYMPTSETKAVSDEDGGIAIKEVPHDPNFFDRKLAAFITQELERDPSQFLLLQDVMYFTPDDINYFAAPKALAGQYIKITEKDFASLGDSLYEFKHENLNGFIAYSEWPNTRSYASATIINRESNRTLTIYFRNHSLEEITDTISGVSF